MNESKKEISQWEPSATIPKFIIDRVAKEKGFTKHKIENILKGVEALELKRNGATNADIKKKLKLNSVSIVDSLIATVLRFYGERTIAEMRTDCNSKYERLLLSIEPKAYNGDRDSIKTMLTILKDQRSLFGLDAPAKVSVDVTNTPNEMFKLTFGNVIDAEVIEEIEKEIEEEIEQDDSFNE